MENLENTENSENMNAESEESVENCKVDNDGIENPGDNEVCDISDELSNSENPEEVNCENVSQGDMNGEINSISNDQLNLTCDNQMPCNVSAPGCQDDVLHVGDVLIETVN